MSFFIGLDIGGTKIAGAVFDTDWQEIGQKRLPTPSDYPGFLTACRQIVEDLDRKCDERASVGIGIPGAIDREKGTIFAPNLSCLQGNTFHKDIQKAVERPIAIANDAACAALSEAMDGAGVGHRVVFGAVMGTGVGGGLVIDRRPVEGPNGLTGEWGHLPLPFREEADGPVISCGCGQQGCIDKSISGPALSRFYEALTKKQADAAQIADLVRRSDAEAIRVLDRFYSTVAKAMVTVIHTFDPDVIVVSGGLSNLPGLYKGVPKLWGNYAVRKNLRTRFVQAKHGAASGLRGAAWLGKTAKQID